MPVGLIQKKLNLLNLFLESNMWPFSYFKKRKEERLRLIEEAKQKAIAERKDLYIEHKSYIDEIVQTHYNDQRQKRDEYIDKKERSNKKLNHTCPRCKCNEVIEVFRRPKGELKGSFNSSSSSSYSHSLFSGYGLSSHSANGKIEGSLDTLKVNRCSKCGHEWEKLPENIYPSEINFFPGEEDWDNYATYFINHITRLINKINEFDPNRLDNEFNNVDEIIEDAKDNIWYKAVKDWSLELLYYMAFTNRSDVRKIEEVFNEYEYDDGGEKYIGSFSQEYEEILINHFGFKKHFK